MTLPSRLRAITVLVGIASAACGSGDQQSATNEADGSGNEEPSTAVVAEAFTGGGAWTALASDRTPVALSAADTPLTAGTVTFEVKLDSPGRTAHSVDLVSPEMPMHGMVRFRVVDDAAQVAIPMEGRWALYVNLDEAGANSAEFVIDVAPSDEADHQHPGGR